jgi:hypothetical protein
VKGRDFQRTPTFPFPWRERGLGGKFRFLYNQVRSSGRGTFQKKVAVQPLIHKAQRREIAKGLRPNWNTGIMAPEK